MKRIRLSETIVINKVPAIVFDFTQDYHKRLLWDTFLKKAELTDGAVAAAKGIRAYCVSRVGLGMITEYVSFDRPHATAVKMIKGPFLFAMLPVPGLLKKPATVTPR